MIFRFVFAVCTDFISKLCQIVPSGSRAGAVGEPSGHQVYVVIFLLITLTGVFFSVFFFCLGCKKGMDNNIFSGSS